MSAKKILLGVTGGIAAYKTPELVRRLTERGAEVQVVMTAGARHFVTETSLQAVSGRPVRHDLWDSAAEAAMGHIELARWADHVIVAPATAEFLSRLAAGGAADLLTTLCLATEAPLTVAPAMNHVMWANPAVQHNRRVIADRGVDILGPAEGDQACGETGPGRMVEPNDIVAHLFDMAASTDSGSLAGRTVVITAGPTREAIDPVRYISNHSSGKMGYALAEAARDAGASVVLLSGPVDLPAPSGIEIVHIETADELNKAAHDRVRSTDIFIAAAAVADYRPASVAADKIKKTDSDLSINLVRNPDVLASIAGVADGPFTVGFAAETERLREHALKKLKAKRLDMIIANEVGDGKAFGQDENAVHVFWSKGEREFPMRSKRELASDLISLIVERYADGYGGATVTELPSLARKD